MSVFNRFPWCKLCHPINQRAESLCHGLRLAIILRGKNGVTCYTTPLFYRQVIHSNKGCCSRLGDLLLEQKRLRLTPKFAGRFARETFENDVHVFRVFKPGNARDAVCR